MHQTMIVSLNLTKTVNCPFTLIGYLEYCSRINIQEHVALGEITFTIVSYVFKISKRVV